MELWTAIKLYPFFFLTFQRETDKRIWKKNHSAAAEWCSWKRKLWTKYVYCGYYQRQEEITHRRFQLLRMIHLFNSYAFPIPGSDTDWERDHEACFQKDIFCFLKLNFTCQRTSSWVAVLSNAPYLQQGSNIFSPKKQFSGLWIKSSIKFW